jgi:hypothetical protein
MGLSLGLLGRGDAVRAWRYGAVHVLGAVVGGATVGLGLGLLGSLLGLGAWRAVIVGAVALAALAVAVARPVYQLGRQRQVPRRWARGVSPSRIYAIWGLMMGCGLYTPVYHTALFVLLALQLTSGPGWGLLTGALFGLARQATALWPVARKLGPEATMGLLETLRPTARGLNIALVVAALLLAVALSRAGG